MSLKEAVTSKYSSNHIFSIPQYPSCYVIYKGGRHWLFNIHSSWEKAVPYKGHTSHLSLCMWTVAASLIGKLPFKVRSLPVNEEILSMTHDEVINVYGYRGTVLSELNEAFDDLEAEVLFRPDRSGRVDWRAVSEISKEGGDYAIQRFDKLNSCAREIIDSISFSFDKGVWRRTPRIENGVRNENPFLDRDTKGGHTYSLDWS